MPEDNQATGRGLLLAVGIALLAIGGQPLVNYLSCDSSLKTATPSIIVVAVGILLVLFRRSMASERGTRSKTNAEIVRVGSIADGVCLPLLAVWVYMETSAARLLIRMKAAENDQQSITEALDRFVVPRQLTIGQIETIGHFLSSFPAQDVNFRIIAGDEEASSYSVEIMHALEKAGWRV
jgi:hypothetical protein